MRSGRHSVLKLTIALFVCSLTVAAQQATSRTVVIRNRVQCFDEQATKHMLEVEVRVKRPAGMQVPAEDFLLMPVWTPAPTWCASLLAMYRIFQQRILPDALCSGKRRTKTPGAS